MEEKIIVRSTSYDIKKRCALTSYIIAGCGIVAYILFFLVELRWNLIDDYYWKKGNYSSAWTYSLKETSLHLLIILGSVLVFVGIIWLIYWIYSKCEIVVTDRRVYGRVAWGKRVDLPLDSVSAVGIRMFKGVSVSTSSGLISFLFIKNRNEIHKCISSLLVERQSKAAPVTTIKQEIPQSNADELKKYKELFDSGVITQEEFDAKKKQLLGL